MDPNPAVDPEQEQPAPPPLWVEVKNDPAFKALPPEKQLVTFARWHDDAFNHLSKQPDWATSSGEFNTRAAQEQDALQKAAGVAHPDEARVKIGQEAIANATANGQPLTHQQERNALQPLGPDVWRAYLNHHTGADVAPETTLNAFGHEVANAYREAGATLAKSIATTSAYFTAPDKPHRTPEEEMQAYDTFAKSKQDMLAAMPPDHPDRQQLENEVAGLQADRANVAGKWNARTEAFTNAVTDLHNTLENIDPILHVDPKLKDTLPAQAARLAAGVGTAIAEASIPGVGLPLLLTQSSAQAYGTTLDATNGDEKAARSAMVRSMAANLVFMGAAHGVNSGLAKALERTGAGPLLTKAVAVTGASAGNVVIGQALAAGEAAADAPEGKKYQAFMDAATKPEFDNIAQGIAFGILGAKPIESMVKAAKVAAESRTAADAAAAKAKAGVAPIASDLRESGSPLTADTVEAGAVADAAAQQPAGIRLASRQTTDGTYQHNFTIPAETTVEQLQQFKQNLDTSHLPPEAAKSITDQIDAEIARKGPDGATETSGAPADRAAQPAAPQEAAGPRIVSTAIRDSAKPENVVRGDEWNSGHDTFTMKALEAGIDISNDATMERGFIVKDPDGTERFVNRQEAAPLAIASGQAAEGVTNLRSQDLIEQPVAALHGVGEPETRAVVAPEGDKLAPAPAARPLPEPAKAPSVAAAAKEHAIPRTPEEKAAKVEAGRAEGQRIMLETGIVPSQAELHKLTGNSTDASKLSKELKAQLAVEYPPAAVPEGSKTTTTKNELTGDALPSVIDANGKVTAQFTNDPNLTAQQIDLGIASTSPTSRLYIPDELATTGKVNPSIRYAKEKGTGKYYVIGSDAKLPGGKTIHVNGPDELTKPYQEASRLSGAAQKPLALTPETLQQVATAVEKGLAERKLDFGPMEFHLEDQVDPGEATPVEGEVKVEIPSEGPHRTVESLTDTAISNHELIAKLGISKPRDIENPVGVAIKAISTNNQLPANLRILAKELIKAGIDFSKVQLHYMMRPDRYGAGVYTSAARVNHGRIDLNLAAIHPGSVAETLLHEASHHATLLKVADNYRRTPMEEKAYQKIKAAMEQVTKETFKAETGREGTPEELAKFAKSQADRRIKSEVPHNSGYYGLSHIREFVAETLSSPRFQKFLSSFESAEPGVKGRIGNLLNAVRNALKDLFAGREVKRGSVLDHALEASFKLLKEPVEQERVGTGKGTSAELQRFEEAATKLPPNGPARVEFLKSMLEDHLGIRKVKRLAETDELGKMSRRQLEKEYTRQYGSDGPDLEMFSSKELRDALTPDKLESARAASAEATLGEVRNGWLGPDGKVHEVGAADTHEDLARRTLIEQDPALRKEFQKAEKTNPNMTPIEGVVSSRAPVVDFMISKGYVRVAEDVLGAIYFQGKPSKLQLRQLRDAAIEKGVSLIQDMGARDRVLYEPNSAAQRAEPRPEIVHEVDETGKVTNHVEIPDGSKPEDMRKLLDTIASGRLPDAEKQRLSAEVGAKLESYPMDTAAQRFSSLQEEIATQPDGPTEAQSAELEKIKADLPDVVEHPNVQRSAQSLGIIPGYLDINDRLATLRNGTRNYFRSRKPSEWWAAWLNAADNKSAIFARQKVNDVRGMLREALNRANAPTSWKDILNLKEMLTRKGEKANSRDETALTFVVEAQGDVKNLAAMRTQIQNALSAPGGNRKPGWVRAAGEAIKAIDFATANFQRLSIAADFYTKMMQDQVRLENANGIATNYRKGYVPHLQEVETGFDTLFDSGASGVAGTGFKQARAYDTFAESIAAGVTPKTLNAATAMENRIHRGLKTMNRQLWAESGKSLTDPTTGKPIVTDPIVDKHPVSGDSMSRAPSGYKLRLMGGKQVAVHEGYASLYDSFTRPSTIRDHPAGNLALKTAGAVKHGLLLFDTFHLGRLAFYQAPLRRLKATFSKGLMSLDYSDQELQNMERRGQLPSHIKAADLIARKGDLNKLIDAGYNLGGVQEALNAGLIRRIPVLGDFNKFVFEQYQRGGMAESGLIEFDRQRKAFPELSEADVARKVAKELNTRFGNLRKEGWLKSDTMADLAQLLLLAPHWNEGLLKSEFGAGAQGIKAIKDATVGNINPTTSDRERSLRAGSLLKGSGGLLLGTFVMNQIINYITRGTPTWENPEEGVGSKVSAWIPDKIGGGPGFFLNPFTLPAEITHQVIDVMEKGKTPLQALAQVAGYKLAPAAQAALTFKTRNDKFGQPLATDADVMREMIGDVSPLPIFGQAAYAATTSIGNQKVREPFKGAIEKQAFSTLGIKLTGAPSDRTRLSHLATEFNKSKGITPDPRFNTSDFSALTRALENNDDEQAKKEFDKLALTKTQKQIDEHYEKQVSAPFTRSKTREGDFYDSLKPEQQKAYDRAVQWRENLRDKYYSLELMAPEPNDG